MYIVIALKIKKRWQNINVKKRVFYEKIYKRKKRFTSMAPITCEKNRG